MESRFAKLMLALVVVAVCSRTLRAQSTADTPIVKLGGDWRVKTARGAEGSPADIAKLIAAGQTPKIIKFDLQATFTNKYTLGGHVLESDYSGTVDGNPYSGRSFLGINSLTGKYYEFYADSLGQAFYLEAEKQEVTEKGVAMYYKIEGQDYKSEYVIDDNNAFTYRLTLLAKDKTKNVVVKETEFARE